MTRVAATTERARLVLGAGAALLLIFPFLVILAQTGSFHLPLTSEVASVFALTVWQATLSASTSLVFGIIGGMGLLWATSRFSPRASRGLELAALLPNAAPVLILLLSVVKFFPWARGLPGIVLVHTLLNVGLVSVAFSRLVRAKIAGVSELAWLEGSSSYRFFLRGAWPILRADLGLLFLFVFAVCFSSFAVPLMIGGSKATTIEVLIYQKMRISADWSQALGLAALQLMSLIVFSFILTREESSSLVSGRASRSPLLKWAPGLAIALAPSVILVGGLFEGSMAGYRQLDSLSGLKDELSDLLAGSALIGFGTGVLVISFLLVLAYVRPSGWFRKFMLGYAAPSSVLVGLGILMFWRELGLASYFKIMLGLTLVSVPSFYRYQWDAVLSSLDGQIAVARTLGAGSRLLFWRVVLPQIIQSASIIGGLSALWAWGDFALSSVIAERSITLAMVVRGLMGSYRLDAATFLVWILMLGGLATFAIIRGAGYVLGSKSQT